MKNLLMSIGVLGIFWSGNSFGECNSTVAINSGLSRSISSLAKSLSNDNQKIVCAQDINRETGASVMDADVIILVYDPLNKTVNIHTESAWGKGHDYGTRPARQESQSNPTSTKVVTVGSSGYDTDELTLNVHGELPILTDNTNWSTGAKAEATLRFDYENAPSVYKKHYFTCFQKE